MDAQSYWRAVSAQESALSTSEVWITSVEKRELGSVAGRTVLVGKRLAAEFIVKGTHREATPDEIAADLKAQEERRIQDAEANYALKQQFAMPRELTGVVEAIKILAEREFVNDKKKSTKESQ